MLTQSVCQVNYFSAQRIITPYALPLFKEEGARQKSTYRQMVKDRKVGRLPFSFTIFLSFFFGCFVSYFSNNGFQTAASLSLAYLFN
jgi:hypothetical protein